MLVLIISDMDITKALEAVRESKVLALMPDAGQESLGFLFCPIAVVESTSLICRKVGEHDNPRQLLLLHFAFFQHLLAMLHFLLQLVICNRVTDHVVRVVRDGVVVRVVRDGVVRVVRIKVSLEGSIDHALCHDCLRSVVSVSVKLLAL